MRSLLLAILFIPFLLQAQHNQYNAAKIKHQLKKLNFLGSVLYVAAHPDDENTRIITYLANDRLAATAYLSMTRGDGGQNLIGSEIRDLLGLIRTQELLAARRIDGGQQFFTRANDFGYSKSAAETFAIWGKDEILHDVVKVFRMYQPDVIITRFPADERAGHGHHTGSAMLAEEAFDLSSKRDIYTEQVKQFGAWQCKRLYTNTGRWWNTTINENTPGVITLNVGGYNTLLGQSYTEIAATSRSQHKSQGFGSAGARGDQLEFLEYVKGEKATKEIFEGVNTTWSRLPGAERVQQLVDKAIIHFDEEKPAASVPVLNEIRNEILKLNSSVWKERKLKEVEEVIQNCLGLFIEVTADQYWVAPGEHVKLNFELINRSDVTVALTKISSSKVNVDSTLTLPLKYNVPILISANKIVNATAVYSDPYWLKEPHGIGTFVVNDKHLIGKAENDPAITFQCSFTVGKEKLQFNIPLIYKWTDPVKGELQRPFEIVPPIFINLPDPVIIFKDEKPKQIDVLIKAARMNLKGNLKLLLPEGWKSEPATIPFTFTNVGEEQTIHFKITPANKEMTGSLQAIAEINGKAYQQSIQLIAYDHIPIQTLLPNATAKVVRLDLKNTDGLIGYINGAGDEVPAALRNMGYEVWEMKNEEVTPANLQRVSAVVLGIRALNTNPRIKFMMNNLLDYVKGGGTMVVQYNTNANVETPTYSPYPLSLSRDRVTEEDAEVRILRVDHPVLNSPHKITSKDFEGWVQERGLYFPNTWDKNFEAILSMNDTGETPKDGSLLVAKYGEGYYVYTSLSFFRELPEGVPGAYKLFSNIVSLSRSRNDKNLK